LEDGNIFDSVFGSIKDIFIFGQEVQNEQVNLEIKKKFVDYLPALIIIVLVFILIYKKF
jgi:hypothetical protein